MSIAVATDHPMFLLSTATTSYGLEVTDAGAVVNLYWGARLDRVEENRRPSTFLRSLTRSPGRIRSSPAQAVTFSMNPA